MTETTKIYVVYGGWDYEGNNNPKYVGNCYATAERMTLEKGYDHFYIDCWSDGKLLERRYKREDEKDWRTE